VITWILDEANLAKFLPEQFSRFDAIRKQLDDLDVYHDIATAFIVAETDAEELLFHIGPNGRVDGEIVRSFVVAYDELCAAFATATQVDNSFLSVSLNYHDSNAEGDRYDDVDGFFWEVSGCTRFTPAMEKFRSSLIIQQVGFVQYG
jgi:hypothetical protein